MTSDGIPTAASRDPIVKVSTVRRFRQDCLTCSIDEMKVSNGDKGGTSDCFYARVTASLHPWSDYC